MTQRSAKSSLPLIPLLHSQQVVGIAAVQLRKDGSLVEGPKGQ